MHTILFTYILKEITLQHICLSSIKKCRSVRLISRQFGLFFVKAHLGIRLYLHWWEVIYCMNDLTCSARLFFTIRITLNSNYCITGNVCLW